MANIELQSDSDAFESLARDVATMYMNRCGNNFVQSVGNDFINTVGFSMHLRPDEEKIKEGNSSDSVFFSQTVLDDIKHVIDTIIDYGGNDPYMIIYPVVIKIEKPKELFDNVLSLPLFRIRHKNNEGESRYVDTSGRIYSDSNDFINNAQFPKCEMWYPTNLIFSHDNNKKAQISYTTISPSIMLNVDETVSLIQYGVNLMVISADIERRLAIAIQAGCMGYKIGRTIKLLFDRSTHGQTINPLADRNAFHAWCGLAAKPKDFGLAGNAKRLSENMAEVAAEGLRIVEACELTVRASIYTPEANYGGLMADQFYQLVRYWNQIPVEHKIIIGLQFVFFAAASYKMGIISSKNIEERVAEISFNELSEELVRQADNSAHASLLRSNLEAATNRIGGISVRAINFSKKLVNYNSGELITAGVNENKANYLTLIEKAGEIGFQLRQKYFTCTEAAMDINDGVNSDPNEPSSSSSFDAEFRLPESDGNPILIAASRLAEVKKFVPKESIKTAKDWLKNALLVNDLENYHVNGVQIFKNMKYHDQIGIRVFEDIGESLNEGLIRTCIQFAEEGNARTVGQFASDYEIASLQIHKQAIELAQTFEHLNPEEIRNQHQIDIRNTIETRMTYADLAKERGSTFLADELKRRSKKLTENEDRAISNIGTDNAQEIYNNWKAKSEIPFERKTVGNAEADVHTLANEIIDAGRIFYPNSSNQAINAAKLIAQYPRAEPSTFVTDMANEANDTIQSCRGNVESRVFEVTRQKEKLPIRRLIFWNLDDENFGRSTMVTVNRNTGEVNIQNFLLKKIKTSATVNRNPKTAIMDHWNRNFNYRGFKTKLTQMTNTIKEQCEEYVGHAVIRSGLDHDSTVNDIQSLKSVRFASIEQAICHVLKHGENLSDENLVAVVKDYFHVYVAVKDYFDKSQEIIQYTKDHPENISSSWTQTGSARDFFFYRKSADQQGVEKVVVLVREGGEVILKTYFYDDKFTSVPTQQKHPFRPAVDIKHASLLTFYFQLMLLAPRYGVLLPKDYEIYNTDMNAKKSRIIIIMAGHYFEDSKVPKTRDLSKALAHVFPINKISWNVVAMKIGSNYSFDVFDYQNNYLNCRIKDFGFLIFTPRISPDNTVRIIGDKIKYMGYAVKGTVKENRGFNDEASGVANRICSSTDKATEITKALKEVFGGCWSCIVLSDFDYDLYLYKVFLKLNFNGDSKTCCIFRC